jgi:Fic family protein
MYFVAVQPFADGNGRLGRLLSYLILMDAGYDFFGRVAFSSLLLKEKSRYYKAIRTSISPENGGDFTYFAEYYIGMLARSLDGVSEKLQHMSRLEAISAILDPREDRRAINGAKWMIEESITTITTEQWRSHFDISFETARQDLHKLEGIGFVNKNIIGRKHFYEVW